MEVKKSAELIAGYNRLFYDRQNVVELHERNRCISLQNMICFGDYNAGWLKETVASSLNKFEKNKLQLLSVLSDEIANFCGLSCVSDLHFCRLSIWKNRQCGH